jgi:hypothetical protein
VGNGGDVGRGCVGVDAVAGIPVSEEKQYSAGQAHT